MATRKSTKPVLAAVPKSPNISTERRLDLAQDVGFQVSELVPLIRQQVAAMIMAETHAQETAIRLCLDRLDALGEALTDLGTTSDDHAHSEAELERIIEDHRALGYCESAEDELEAANG